MSNRLIRLAILLAIALFALCMVIFTDKSTKNRLITSLQKWPLTNSLGPLIPPSETAANATSLIIVPCHAIWKGGATNGLEDNEWWLDSFQKNQVDTFVDHVRTGVQLAQKDPRSILIFSGGQTNRRAGPISEAQSYWALAQAAGLLNNGLDQRVTVEEYSRDSYENLLFSIARFHEYTDSYPTHITVVGFDFKRARFEDLHRAAIGFPKANFKYVGQDDDSMRVNPPGEGELKNAFLPFTDDPHGCKTKTLIQKKLRRNPFRRTHPYLLTCPELYGLLSICQESHLEQLLDHNLPWGSY